MQLDHNPMAPLIAPYDPEKNTLVSSLSIKSYSNILENEIGRMSDTLRTPTKPIKQIFLTNDGSTLIGISSDMKVVFWDMMNHQLQSFIELGIQENADIIMNLTPDKFFIVNTSADYSIKISDLELRLPPLILTGHEGSITSLAISSDGSLIATGSDDKSIKIWNFSSRLVIKSYPEQEEPIACLTFSPSNEFVYGGYNNGEIKAWNLSTGETEIFFTDFKQNSSRISKILFESESRLIISGDIQKIVFYDTEIKSEKALSTLNQRVNAMVMLKNTKTLFCATDSGKVLQISIIHRNIDKIYNQHNLTISDIICTADEKYFITCSNDNTIKLTKFDMENQCGVNQELSDQPWSAFFINSSGTHIILAHTEPSLKLWNLQKNTEEFSLQWSPDNSAYGLLTSDKNHLVIIKDSNKIAAYNIKEKSINYESDEYPECITAIYFSPDSKILFLKFPFYAIAIDYDTKNELYRLNEFCTPYATFQYTTLTISPDNKRILLGNDKGAIEIWDLESKAFSYEIKIHSNYINSVEISADSTLIYSAASDGFFKIYNLAEKSVIFEMNQESVWIKALKLNVKENLIAFSKDDKSFALFSLEEKLEKCMVQLNTSFLTNIIFIGDSFVIGAVINNIQVINTKEQKAENEIIAHSDRILFLHYIEKDDSIISGSLDINIKIWSFELRRLKYILKSYCSVINTLSICKNNKFCAFASESTVYLLSIAEKEEKAALIGHQRDISSIAFSPNSSYVATGSYDSSLILWDTSTYEIYKKFTGHTDFIRTVAFGINGDYVFSAGDDSKINAWNIESKVLEFSITGYAEYIYTLCMIPNGSYIVSGSNNNSIKAWNLQSRNQGFSLVGHSACIIDIKCLSDSKTLVSGSKDNIIIIWDFEENAILKKFQNHSGSLLAFGIANQETSIISYSDDNKVKNWCIRPQKEKFTLQFESRIVYAIALSNHDEFIAFGNSEGYIKIMNVNDKHNSITIKPHVGDIKALKFNKNSTLLYSSSVDATIIATNVQTKLELASCDIGTVDCIEFSSDQQYLIAGFKDNYIRLLNPISLKQEFILQGHNRGVFSLAVALDGKYLYSGSSDSTVIKWSLEKMKKEFVYRAHKSSVFQIALSVSGKILVSCSSDKTVKLWDTANNQSVSLFKGHSEWVRSVLITKDEEFVISASDDNSIKIWGIKANALVNEIKAHNGSIFSIKLSDDEKILYSCGSDKAVFSWDFNSKTRLNCLTSFSGNVYAMLIKSDNLTLISGSDDNAINITCLNDLNSISCMPGHLETVSSLAISKDELILISGSYDKSIKVWSLETYSEICTFQGHEDKVRAVAITNSNLVLSASADQTIKLWSISSKVLISSIFTNTQTILSINLSIDQRFLISSSLDKSIKIWNLEKLSEEAELLGHTEAVRMVVITTDGKRIISASEDKSIRVWSYAERCEEFTLYGHNHYVVSLVASSDSEFFFSASEDHMIKGWSLIYRREIASINWNNSPAYALALSHNNEFLFSSTNSKSIKAWNLQKSPILLDKSKSQRNLTMIHTDDLKYSLYFDQAQIDFINPSGVITRCGLDVNEEFHPCYADLQSLYAAVRTNNYSNLTTKATNLTISKFHYTIVHILCQLGKAKELLEIDRQEFIVLADYFGKSPFYYAIVNAQQGCIDILLDFLIELFDKGDQGRITISLNSMHKDFAMIIKNSARKLHLFLRGIFISSQILFTEVDKKLPIYHYSINNFARLQHFEELVTGETTKIPVVLQYMPFSLPCTIGSRETIDLLSSILACSNTQIYSTPFIQFFIQLQWEALKGWITVFTLLLFLNLILLVLLLMNFNNWLFLSLMILVNLLLFIWEIIQLITSGCFEYFSDIWNTIDCFRFTITVLWIVLDFIGIRFQVLSWFVGLLNFARGLTGFRLFDGTRYYVRLILRALNEMKYFMIMLSYSTITFGVLFQVSRENEDLNFKTLWMDSYGLNFGMFDLSNKGSFSIEGCGYILATVINVVLMLNLLISILGDSYEQFQIEKKIIDFHEKAEFILELQTMLFRNSRICEFKYLHVLAPAYEEEYDDWEGRILFLDKKIERQIAEMGKNHQETQDKLSERAIASNDNLERKLLRLETIIADRIPTGDMTQAIEKRILKFEEGLNEKIVVLGNKTEVLEGKISSLEANIVEIVENMRKMLEILSGKNNSS